MEKNDYEGMNSQGLIEDIQRIEILINSLSDQLIDEDNPFGFNTKIMTKEEMKKQCTLLRGKIKEWDGINKTNTLYYDIQSEIINGIADLELSIDYYINNGNLYRVFEEKLAEIATSANKLDIDDETSLKLLMDRYEHYLKYASDADININAIRYQTEEAISRCFIKHNVK